jgi:hypothetical protein
MSHSNGGMKILQTPPRTRRMGHNMASTLQATEGNNAQPAASNSATEYPSTNCIPCTRATTWSAETLERRMTTTVPTASRWRQLSKTESGATSPCGNTLYLGHRADSVSRVISFTLGQTNRLWSAGRRRYRSMLFISGAWSWTRSWNWRISFEDGSAGRAIGHGQRKWALRQHGDCLCALAWSRVRPRRIYRLRETFPPDGQLGAYRQ